jgi:hypothetical protein
MGAERERQRERRREREERSREPFDACTVGTRTDPLAHAHPADGSSRPC